MSNIITKKTILVKKDEPYKMLMPLCDALAILDKTKWDIYLVLNGDAGPIMDSMGSGQTLYEKVDEALTPIKDGLLTPFEELFMFEVRPPQGDDSANVRFVYDNVKLGLLQKPTFQIQGSNPNLVQDIYRALGGK